MSNIRKDYKLYLIDIQTSCTKILKYSKNKTKLDFEKDGALTDAIERNMEIIGEAGSKIPLEIKRKFPQIPWRKAINMRNKLIHDYFNVDVDIIYDTVLNDIPILKRQISKLLKTLGSKKLKLKNLTNETK